jgi:hypothetical protein
MAIIAVVRASDNELVETIVASMGDYCPEGFYFVELPPDHTWHQGRIVDKMALLTGNKGLVEF